jgi:hypothetical protein
MLTRSPVPGRVVELVVDHAAYHAVPHTLVEKHPEVRVVKPVEELLNPATRS